MSEKQVVSENNRELVALLHGIGRTAGSMSVSASHFAEKDYAICNLDYPSRSAPIATLAERIWERLQAAKSETYASLHFVTQSMGGLIFRQLVKDFRPDNLGRAPKQMEILLDTGSFASVGSESVAQ